MIRIIVDEIDGVTYVDSMNARIGSKLNVKVVNGQREILLQVIKVLDEWMGTKKENDHGTAVSGDNWKV